jgi:hypothetical protein
MQRSDGVAIATGGRGGRSIAAEDAASQAAIGLAKAAVLNGADIAFLHPVVQVAVAATGQLATAGTGVGIIDVAVITGLVVQSADGDVLAYDTVAADRRATSVGASVFIVVVTVVAGLVIRVPRRQVVPYHPITAYGPVAAGVAGVAKGAGVDQRAESITARKPSRAGLADPARARIAAAFDRKPDLADGARKGQCQGD